MSSKFISQIKEFGINNYNKIIPCGIKDKEVTNLISIKNQNYENLSEKILNNLINNLKI